MDDDEAVSVFHVKHAEGNSRNGGRRRFVDSVGVGRGSKDRLVAVMRRLVLGVEDCEADRVVGKFS